MDPDYGRLWTKYGRLWVTMGETGYGRKYGPLWIISEIWNKNMEET